MSSLAMAINEVYIRRLRPCPFCGEVREIELQSLKYFFVTCLTCNSMGPDSSESESAVYQWNKRLEPEDATRWSDA